MSRPRIAYFVNRYPWMSHSFIRREILAVERRGFEVQRIALRGWDSKLADEEDRLEQARTRYVLEGGLLPLLGAALRAFFRAPRRFMGALGLALRMARRAERPLPYHLAYLAEACRMLPWLAAFGAQHVHAHFGTNSAEVVMLAHALGGPSYSFTVHGPDEFDRPQFLGLAEKTRRAARVVAISAYARGQLMRWVDRAHWSKISVVHCGLDAAFLQAPPAPPAEAPRLVCVGRLSEQKAQTLLVEAAHRVARRHPGLQLLLAGDGEMRGEIEALIEELGMQDRVRITGWISNQRVRDEIAASRALVLASLAEGLPVVLMEALALRRPVLATCVAGIPELVLPGENGWLVAAGDLDALVAAMEDLLSRSPAQLQAMGEAGRRRVLERHSIDDAATQLAAIFEESCA